MIFGWALHYASPDLGMLRVLSRFFFGDDYPVYLQPRREPRTALISDNLNKKIFRYKMESTDPGSSAQFDPQMMQFKFAWFRCVRIAMVASG